MQEPSSAVVHFYRAIVMHGDVWRERLDATTNWAVVTTIGVISFAFTRPQAPHFILLLLIGASGLFLVMESRRYQIYDLWRRRIRSINKYIIAPQLAPDDAPEESEIKEELSALANDLGRAVPHLRFIDAMGYRLRRNYGYIYLFTVGSWLIKLYLHPIEATTVTEFVDRAAAGMIPGSWVIAGVAITSALTLYTALRAPSEQMVKWRQVPSPLSRLRHGALVPRIMTEEEEERRAVRPGALEPRPLSEQIEQRPTTAGLKDSDDTDREEPGEDDHDESPRPSDED